MTDKKQVNMSINDGNEFFAHEVSVNFNPMQFIFDFKCITPRNDARSQSMPFISLKHNIVLVDAHHAKRIHELLGTVIARYEEQFGKIEAPKAMKRWEKNRQKEANSKKVKEKTETKAPSYLG
jgi:hypothetical protein